MKRKSTLNRAIGATAFALLAAAVVQELRKPPEERTWHGRVFDLVPYDLRMPTFERIRQAYWNPDNPSVFADRVLGVGWGINFYQIWRKLHDLSTRAA